MKYLNHFTSLFWMLVQDKTILLQNSWYSARIRHFVKMRFVWFYKQTIWSGNRYSISVIKNCLCRRYSNLFHVHITEYPEILEIVSGYPHSWWFHIVLSPSVTLYYTVMQFRQRCVVFEPVPSFTQERSTTSSKSIRILFIGATYTASFFFENTSGTLTQVFRNKKYSRTLFLRLWRISIGF